jgi:2-oxoisovalerate dehydrogenase E1 component
LEAVTETPVRLDLVTRALLIRGVEEELLALFAQGKLFGTVHTCIGQEWTGIAIAECTEPGDLFFSNHRGHGHFLARTDDVEGLIAEIMGKQTGVCGGRGGSQHLCSEGFFTNGIQGGIVPVAAGLALAQKLRGSSNITVVFIGDGTLGEGALYETLNIASKWKLPLLIVLENNRYAQSTSQRQTLAGDIGSRAAAFGIQTFHSNTWDPHQCLEDAAESVRLVREHGEPSFLQIDTYRLMAHSKGDDDRDPREVKEYWSKDPLTRFIQQFPQEAEQIKATVRSRITEAVARAEAAPYAIRGGPRTVVPFPDQLHWQPTQIPNQERAVNLLHAGLERNMRRDERIFLLGEDIEGPYGGAFKVTKQLSQQFPGRVRNTPISEAAIVGLGNGLALNGMIPVCEIMFGDFLGLAFDQLLNHAAKFRYMYNEQIRVPLVVRTPMGGKRGYGPTHSQSIEKHFLGLTDTVMLALHSRYDPGLIYDQIFASIDCPVLVMENKHLYGLRVTDQAPPGFVLEHSNERYPTTRIRPQGKPEVTLFCYGGLLPDVEKALEILFLGHEIIGEVICPTQLHPFNPAAVRESVEQTGRLLIVEEGQNFAALGAEVAAQLLEQGSGTVRQFRRLGPPPHPIPSCGPLEKELLPGPALIVQAVREMLADA